MSKLFLLRHLKSQWNDENRFAGWTDGPLEKGSEQKAKELSGEIFKTEIDIVYTSPLFRNMDTVAEVFDPLPEKYPFFIHLDGGRMQRWGNYVDITENDVPAYVTERLNERYYGRELQGLNKEEIVKKYGEEKVHQWRRSYTIAPPGGESLRDVCKRTTPFYQKYIEKDLKAGKNVLVVASHNSLRAIVKYVENIPDEKIIDLELPFGALVRYEFDGGKYSKFA
jgi:2,3-bisphosphoglycerate-dependent phosphoglycerate mutase